MRHIARRAFLRIVGAAPVAAAALDAQTKIAAHSLASGQATGLMAAPSALSDGAKELKFTDFIQWWRKFGDKQARENARQVSAFDPDIMEMRLPLATKVRLQRTRNYDNERRRMERNFADAISTSGFWSWWG